MRFLQTEYKSIIQTITKAGLTEAHFSFVKKKGHLYINHLESNTHFYFFRKTATILNADKQWEKSKSYKFGIGKNEEVSENWEDVLKAFQLWLKELS